MDKLDILNRDAFIEQLLKLIENISDNKSSTCFAINGPWGCGKTFVLDMFQEQLEQIQDENTCTNKYFVIPYNCWKFDYYEEPLVAIVASMMSIIEEKTKLFPDSEQKRAILGMLKAVGVTLLSIGNATLQEKTGLDFQKAYEIICNGKQAGVSDYETVHDYDAYFNFNEVLQKLIDLIKSLAQDYTIIFLVDELDRCLPEYAIKVLERLHHLADGQSNIITIISIDKEQLLSSVKQIFGFEYPEKYLQKFINFEVKLDYGTVADTICSKYADYVALFDKDIFLFDEPVEECLQAIFKDVDIRTQEQLMKKAMLTHKLLYSDKKDYSFMCMEVLLSVMICVYHDNSCFSNSPIDLDSFDDIFINSRKSVRPPFADFFKQKFEKIEFKYDIRFSDDPKSYILPDHANLYGAILFTWFWMHTQHKQSIIQYIKSGIYESISQNYVELKKFAEMIRMIS